MKNSTLILSVASLAWIAGPLLSQSIQKLDPAIDQIVPPDAKLEQIATGFNKWTEGPVWTRERTLLFAEIPANNIVQWRPGQAASVFIHPSGYKGSTPFAGPEPGSNGMTLGFTRKADGCGPRAAAGLASGVAEAGWCADCFG